MEEGLAAGSLSWQGAEGADGHFQVCITLGTVSVCECKWLLCCAANAAVLLLLLSQISAAKGNHFGPLRDAKYRREDVAAQSEGCFCAIVELSCWSHARSPNFLIIPKRSRKRSQQNMQTLKVRDAPSRSKQ